MKKWIYALLLVFSMCFLAGGPVLAANSRADVEDGADLLTDGQEQALKQRLDDISGRYNMDIVIVTTDTLGQKTATAYADDYYDDNGYTGNGILLLISMEDRDWAISTAGNGIKVFTDAGQRYMTDQFLPYLSDGDYNEAFTCFADLCERFLEQAENEKPYDQENIPKDPVTFSDVLLYLVGIIPVAAIAALITVCVMRSRLKSVRPERAAADYVRAGSMEITHSSDYFLYSTVSRHKRPEPQESSGGSSTHISSSGTTHGGSSGKF